MHLRSLLFALVPAALALPGCAVLDLSMPTALVLGTGRGAPGAKRPGTTDGSRDQTKKRRTRKRRTRKRPPAKRRPAPPRGGGTQPADPPSTPPSSACDGSAECGALVGITAEHNAARSAVGVSPLTWSATLNRDAQAWANQLAANDCQLAHEPDAKYGENLYWSSQPATVKQVVAAWTAEAAQYDADTHSCSGSTCGHYTQVVWGNTTQIGCGMASCGDKQVWVCDYDPRGNDLGQNAF